MTVRPARAEDEPAVLAMMARLWPDEEEVGYDGETVFVWERPDGTLGGFASAAVRPFVDGCTIAPCPHLEG